MRKISKNFKFPPEILISKNCKRQILRICNGKDGALSRYYARLEVFNALNALYHNKCAYCESKIDAVATENIEHYRPKSAVSEEDLEVGTTHSGYYWLGNEWTNLLMACPKCNQSGNKGTRFPLRDPSKRMIRHPAYLPDGTVNLELHHFGSDPLSEEDALILNPELKTPSKHLKVVETGELKPVRKSVYGEKTIEICDLNRDGLTTARKKIIDRVVNMLNIRLLAFYADTEPLTEFQFRRSINEIFDEITARLDDKEEYTLVARTIIKKFDSLILSQIEPEFRSIILDQFNIYLGTD